MAELEPCPFCGRTPTVDDCGDHRYFVRCKCGIVQDKLYTQKCDAIRRWNTRKIDKDTNVPSTDCISRREAIEGADKIIERDTSGNNDVVKAMQAWKEWIMALPSAQPEQTDCDYCHENFDGYVRPIEKNSHAFIYFGMNGWELNLRAKGWRGSAKIMYCPMCGRRLERG